MLSLNRRRKLEKIYSLYEQTMYRIAFSVLNDEQSAEDAVHTTILNIAKHLNRFHNVESDECRYYVLKATKNVSIDIYRKNHINASPVEDIELRGEDIQSCDDWLEHLIARHDAVKVISNCISSMPESLRQLMNLKYFCQLENNEIAEMLKITASAVRKRDERLKEYIRECAGDGYDE